MASATARRYVYGRLVSYTLQSLLHLLLPRLGYVASPPPQELLRRSDVVHAEDDWRMLIARARARLAKAHRLLAEGVVDEAGEEAWRAAIDAVNAAAAALWGVSARSHQALRLLVRLLRERGLDVLTEFGVAEALHSYYYNPGGYGGEEVRDMIGHVERLVEKVEEWVADVIEARYPRFSALNPLAPLQLLLQRAAARAARLWRIA